MRVEVRAQFWLSTPTPASNTTIEITQRGGDGCWAIICVKHVKTVFIQVLSCSTQCIVDAWIVALLWKLLQIPSCSTNKANLDKNNFDMIYKTDCCAAIHGQIWMNNVPNESRMIMLSCTEISLLLYLFLSLEIWSQTQVSFFSFSFYSLCRTSFLPLRALLSILLETHQVSITLEGILVITKV